jgi:hypothetical protein
MATKKNSRFDTVILNPDLAKAVSYAASKAQAQANKPEKRYGCIFAQIFVTKDGLRIKGDFLEPVWADEINKVLLRRVRG